MVYQGKTQVINQALLVLVDNIEQAENVDYDAYRDIGRIIFRRSISPTALVIIRYYYDLSSTTVLGNNDILALDMVYHVSPRLNFAAEWGRSDSGAASGSGDAMRLNLEYGAQRFRVVSEYRDIAPTFTFIDSVGFYRQEKGLDSALNWQPSQHITMSLRRSDLKTNQGYSFGSGNYYPSSVTSSGMQTRATTTTSGLDVNSSRTDFEVRLEYPKWPTLAFQRQELSNAGGTTGSSNYAANNYSLSWMPTNKPFSFTATMYQTDQTYEPGTDSTTAVSTGTNTRQLQWSASYRPSDKISLAYNQGRNRSDTSDASNHSTSGTDQLAIRWAPSSKIDINYDRTVTTSLGSITGTSGTTSAISTLAEETTENRYNDNNSRLSVRYSPLDRLSLDFSLSKRVYTSGGSVGYLADSNQTTRSLGLMYQLSDALSLNATLGRDVMAFLEEGRGTVSNNTLSLGANYRVPNSPWNLQLSYSKTSGLGPVYDGFGSSQRMYMVVNDLSDLQARVSYDLGSDSQLSLTGMLSSSSGGYDNLNKSQLEVGYRKKLSNITDLTFGYRFIRNVSAGPSDPRFGNSSLVPGDQNYLTNTFSLVLNTQFNSGIGGSGGMGGFGSSTLNNFQGYRAGSTAFGGSSGSYGMGYGSSYQSLGVFGQSPTSGFSSPFGTGGQGMSTYGGGSSTGERSYETFGSNYRAGQTGGFGGLGDVSGDRPTDVGSLPGAAGGETLPDEDWLNLDDMYSVWW